MNQRSDLQVRMYLDIQRPPHDQFSPSEPVRIFAARFVRKEWPGRRLENSIYYDPRSLEADHAQRASLHVKRVVVEEEQTFVSSANLTGAAQTKNIEVIVHLQSSSFARRLAKHFRGSGSIRHHTSCANISIAASGVAGAERAQ